MLGIGHSDVSRRENGRQGLTKDSLLAHLDALQVTGPDRDFAVALHEAVTNPNAVTGIHPPLAMLARYEDAATAIINAQPALIAGPFQTRAWALEMARQRGMSPAEAEQAAEFRAARSKKILDRGIEYTAFIGEFALRYPACGPEAAVGQWRRLLELSALPQVTIRVVPMTVRSSPLRLGPFVLMQLPQMSVVHLEGSSSSTTLTEPKYVSDYQQDARNLHSVAMSPPDTEGLIAELIDEMEGT